MPPQNNLALARFAYPPYYITVIRGILNASIRFIVETKSFCVEIIDF